MEEFAVLIVPRREQGREKWRGAKKLTALTSCIVLGGTGGSVWGKSQGGGGIPFCFFAE